MANYHVLKSEVLGKWKVKREGGTDVSAWTDTQKEAEQIAKDLASKSGGGEIRIYGLDGKIRDRDTVTPAKDPFPPGDKEH